MRVRVSAGSNYFQASYVRFSLGDQAIIIAVLLSVPERLVVHFIGPVVVPTSECRVPGFNIRLPMAIIRREVQRDRESEKYQC